MDSRVKHCANQLERDPLLSLEALSIGAGVSVSRLQHLFTRELGMSLGTFRRNIKFRHAQRLLSQFVLVKQVQMELGFADASAFARAFKRQHGLSPNSYRQAISRVGADQATEGY